MLRHKAGSSEHLNGIFYNYMRRGSIMKYSIDTYRLYADEKVFTFSVRIKEYSDGAIIGVFLYC